MLHETLNITVCCFRFVWCRFMNKLLFMLPSLHGEFRSHSLEVILSRVDHMTNAYLELKSKGLLTFLEHRYIGTPLLILPLPPPPPPPPLLLLPPPPPPPPPIFFLQETVFLKTGAVFDEGLFSWLCEGKMFISVVLKGGWVIFKQAVSSRVSIF